MFTAGETYTRTQHEKVLIAANASHFVPPNLDEAVAALVAAACRSDDPAVLRQLHNLVPEYHQPPREPVGVRSAPVFTAVEGPPVLAGGALSIQPAHGD
jgi:hypothetical protein